MHGGRNNITVRVNRNKGTGTDINAQSGTRATARNCSPAAWTANRAGAGDASSPGAKAAFMTPFLARPLQSSQIGFLNPLPDSIARCTRDPAPSWSQRTDAGALSLATSP